jgi:hypothetical protein
MPSVSTEQALGANSSACLRIASGLGAIVTRQWCRRRHERLWCHLEIKKTWLSGMREGILEKVMTRLRVHLAVRYGRQILSDSIRPHSGRMRGYCAISMKPAGL